MGPFEAERSEFIRRLRIVEDEVHMISRRVIAVRQNLRDANTPRIRAKLARISGEVDGCASEGFPGAVVAIYHHDTGVKLGELTCDADGLYEGRVGLDSNPQDVDIVATPTGTYAARFDGPVVTPATLSVGANAVDPIVIPPAEDWCCGETDYFPGDCATCDLDLTVVGCSSLGVPGATITVTRVSDSAVLSTGTTGSTGHYIDSFSLGGPSVPVSIAIDSPNTDRLDSQVYSTTLTTGSVVITRTLALQGTTWHCRGGRWFPVPKTLHLSDSTAGPCTLIWDATNGRYNGSRFPISFPGCGASPPGSVNNISYTLTNPSSTTWTLNAFINGSTGISSATLATNTSPPLLMTGSTTGTSWHCAGVNYTLTE